MTSVKSVGLANASGRHQIKRHKVSNSCDTIEDSHLQSPQILLSLNVSTRGEECDADQDVGSEVHVEQRTLLEV